MTVRFDPEALYLALDRARRARRITWRGVCREAGCCASTTSRIAHGNAPDVDNLIRLLVWLGNTDVGPYLIGEPGERAEVTRVDAWWRGERC